MGRTRTASAIPSATDWSAGFSRPDVRALAQSWWFAPIATSILLNVFLLGTRGSLDGHEVLVAQTAREMVRSGDWIHPTLAETPRYQKPPLGYWLSSAVYSTTGIVSPITARLPSVLSSVLMTLLASYVAYRWYGPSLGRTAGLMQATMLWGLTYGSSAVIDMTLSLLVAGAIFCSAADRLFPRIALPWAILFFWSLSGLAVLAKGPIGFAIILLTAAVYRTTRSKGTEADNPRFFFTPNTVLCVPIFLLLALGWPLAVLSTRPEVMSLWMEQSIGRFAAHWGPQTRPWFYYLYQVPLLTLPWAIFWMGEFVGIGRDLIRRRIVVDDKKWLLVVWFVVTLVLLSASEGKREHYILPGLFPLSILAALGWRRWDATGWTTWMRRIVPAVTLLTIAVAISWGVTELVSLDEMESLERYVAGHRGQTAESPLVIQIGSNNHATSFIVDRPMRWCGSWDQVRVSLTEHPRSILLVPRDKVADAVRLLSCDPIDLAHSGTDSPFVFLKPRSVD